MSGKRWNGGKWIRPARRLALYIRDGFSCCYCGRDLRNAAAREITLDHLVPRSAGGGNEASNLMTACRSCNSQRKDVPWVSYAAVWAVARIERLRHAPLNLEMAKTIIEGGAGYGAGSAEATEVAA